MCPFQALYTQFVHYHITFTHVEVLIHNVYASTQIHSEEKNLIVHLPTFLHVVLQHIFNFSIFLNPIILKLHSADVEPCE